MILEMKIPGNCGALLKSIESGMKLLSISPICSCIDRSISISRPRENSTVCITDTSYSIVSVQNGELCPHFKICWASVSDLLFSEICILLEDVKLVISSALLESTRFGQVLLTVNEKTYIVDPQNTIAGLDATCLVSWTKWPHWCNDDRHLWPSTKS